MNASMTQEKAKEVVELLENLLALSEASKIQSTFIPVLTDTTPDYIDKTTAHDFIHGSFNLGGTK